MKRLRTEVEEQISNLFANFLKEQLGEQATSVTTILSNNTLTIRATNCLPPAEQNLVQNKKHWGLLQEVKLRQFEKVKSVLKKQMERVCDCQILNIYSIVAQDGVRLEVFTLSENIEDTLLKTEA
jgi:uncharacterized protein YbcI